MKYQLLDIFRAEEELELDTYDFCKAICDIVTKPQEEELELDTYDFCKAICDIVTKSETTNRLR